jgi:hypothetical protein
VCKPPPVESTDATETVSGVVTDVVVVVVAAEVIRLLLISFKALEKICLSEQSEESGVTSDSSLCSE